jgi:hypothetical protein
MVQVLKQQFSKEEAQKANNCMKKCSMSFTIKRNKYQNDIEFHLTLIRMAIMKNANNNKC